MANVVASGFVAETGFFLSLIIVNFFSYVARNNPQSQVRVFLFWLKNRQKHGQNVGEVETMEKGHGGGVWHHSDGSEAN